MSTVFRVHIFYEHPAGSGEVGCVRVFDEDYILQSDRGPLVASEVRIGDYLKTTPKYMTKILNVEILPEE